MYHIEEMASSILDRYEPSIRTLENEVRTKKRSSREIVSFGIVGLPRTGRKTLGYRFGQYGGNINIVPFQYSYVAHFDWAIRRNNAVHKILLSIRGFIIDEPDELPSMDPPLYLSELNRFFCLLFVFDVSERESLLNARELIFAVCDLYEDMPLPECYLVGNKIDLRDAAGPNRRRVIDQTRAAIAAEQLEMRYYECSAKFCTNVYPLISMILEVATRENV